MAYILNIETSTTNCSVSLSNQGETLVLKEDYGNGYSHAEKLHVYIEEALKEAKINSEQLQAIAVSKGPGSYTGLRIGVSAAKGLAYALNIPLISVSTLQALAKQVEADSGLIVPMLDARRLEVYSAIFDVNNRLVRKIEAQILDENSFEEQLNIGKVFFIGDGVSKTKTLLSHANAIFIENKLPSADQMSALSFDKYKKSDIEDVAYFEPYYLKDFVALKPKNK
ncbi:tRNA (adenosine(37)-N6)-threonylcarbamoyltransferase complex dimerization subunit type 1 TsaB [uncultured Olleya sp.]|uniref:tRNA (adenosine(37)-N6)-threonylcarbamoyltransferase complex dimerization subunit type 1 TsaB n=1 Tax=uncultured Olleya sp. TaxID=757243 RepID=UPI00259699CC|nr:tRNA (adenosine(37)-N6)-threonylcarbamoyltransferase complex dimerization subunit type 1 TsaB [uncultured Olleya sp.]